MNDNDVDNDDTEEPTLIQYTQYNSKNNNDYDVRV